MTEPFASTPAPPYWAVIFTTVRSEVDEGYQAMAAAMSQMAAEQPGWLGEESAREGVGITVSYWSDLDAIAAWKAKVEHLTAQRMGRERWYAAYRVRIARVERDYGFERP
jgi:heme-degrading monooxygenase HmoA